MFFNFYLRIIQMKTKFIFIHWNSPYVLGLLQTFHNLTIFWYPQIQYINCISGYSWPQGYIQSRIFTRNREESASKMGKGENVRNGSPERWEITWEVYDHLPFPLYEWAHAFRPHILTIKMWGKLNYRTYFSISLRIDIIIMQYLQYIPSRKLWWWSGFFYRSSHF